MRGATDVIKHAYNDQFISIHAPHAGSDAPAAILSTGSSLFQSTLPMRGATLNVAYAVCHIEFQSTLPMRGATVMLLLMRLCARFQSTLPMRGATYLHLWHQKIDEISIHAPHAGSDKL